MHSHVKPAIIPTIGKSTGVTGMATVSNTRKSPRKFDDFLRRKFASLAARIERVDLFAHLLGLALAVVIYAFLFTILDWSLDNPAVRWSVYGLFFSLFAVLG